MSPTILPWIREDDFARLQLIIADLSSIKFSEWEDNLKSATSCQTRNGSTRVPVTPHAFAEWLKRTRQTGHLDLSVGLCRGCGRDFAAKGASLILTAIPGRKE